MVGGSSYQNSILRVVECSRSCFYNFFCGKNWSIKYKFIVKSVNCCTYYWKFLTARWQEFSHMENIFTFLNLYICMHSFSVTLGKHSWNLTCFYQRNVSVLWGPHMLLQHMIVFTSRLVFAIFVWNLFISRLYAAFLSDILPLPTTSLVGQLKCCVSTSHCVGNGQLVRQASVPAKHKPSHTLTLFSGLLFFDRRRDIYLFI